MFYPIYIYKGDYKEGMFALEARDNRTLVSGWLFYGSPGIQLD